MSMSGQNELDAKTLRYISENAEVEHTLLTPFRWLIGLGKVIIYILLALGWLLFTQTGWVVNVGEYSLENRREAVCDPRAYALRCDATEVSRFNEEHPHEDYTWDSRQYVASDYGMSPDVHQVSDSSLVPAGLGGMLSAEKHLTAKPWVSFGESEFFARGNDVFRRKSAQMDEALTIGAQANRGLHAAIYWAKGGNDVKVHLIDAPELAIRQGVIPAHAIGGKDYVTWGMCLKQECAADGSDLNYALFWGDVLWTRPALSEHQQHAVDALKNMDTLAFWLQEAHANGVYNDALIQEKFQKNHELIERFLR